MTLFLQTQENQFGHFFIDLKSKDGMLLYYGIKERFEFKLENRNQIILEISNYLKPFIVGYDNFYIPQSSSDFLNTVMQNLNLNYTVIQKNKLEKIIQFQELLPLQKKERIAHKERFKEMGEYFKINLMKANQRRYYEKVIFDDVQVKPGRNLVIDDSCFSGTTYNGIKAKLPEFDFISIFSK